MAKLKVTVAMFHDDEAGGYSVIIPTVPELAAMGETVEDAFAMARECLEISLEASADLDYYNLDHVYPGHILLGTVEIGVPSHPISVGGSGDGEAPLGEAGAPTAKRKVSVALLHQDDSGCYTAITPIFPMCSTQENCAAKALHMVKEKLELDLREPTDWDLFHLDAAYSEHVVVGTIEVELPAPGDTGPTGSGEALAEAPR